MQQLSIPPLYCPFPSTLHPQAEALTQHATSWAQQFHLFEDAAASERFFAEQYWRLIAHVYPTADFASLALIADWNTWGFYLDDLGDRPAVGHDPLAMQHIFDAILAVMHEQPTVRPEPLFMSLHDIWQRIVPRSTLAWRERLRQTLRISFLSYIWEATNRSQQVHPTHDAYVRMRVFTGAWLTYVHFLELVEQIALPAAIQNHPQLRAYLTAVNNTIVWANDLVSFAKEQGIDETHNLITIVQLEQDCSLAEATRLVALYHNEEVRRCLELERGLSILSVPYRPEIEKYIAFAHRFMRSNLDWSMESSRYGQRVIPLMGSPTSMPPKAVLAVPVAAPFSLLRSRRTSVRWGLGGIGGLLASAGLGWIYWQKKHR